MTYTTRRLGTPFDQFLRRRVPTVALDAGAEQRDRALVRANDVRDEAAEFRREVRSLRRDVALVRLAALFADVPEWATAIDVHVLLEMASGIGPALADEIQTELGLFYAIAAGELSPFKRHALVGVLEFQAALFGSAEEAQAA